jgi:hypothetical protein
MVVFSNDREQVGLRPEMEEDLLEAFEGEVASEISDLSEAASSTDWRATSRPRPPTSSGHR